MEQHIDIATLSGGTLERLSFYDVFKVEHFRDGRKIGEYEAINAVTNEGKNRVLETMFNAQTQFGTWYMGLIDNSGYTALAAGDIYDNINQSGNGWDEFDDYTDPANSDSAVSRPPWGEGTASSQAITNASPVTYDITSSGTVKGLFLAAGSNAQTKGDHTAGSGHVLWCTALFSGGDKAVANTDQLKVTFTVSL